MELDSIFSYGSPVTVIVRAIINTQIGAQSFVAGQPIFVFNKVLATFRQSIKNVVASQGVKSLIGTQLNAADSITIEGISTSPKLLSLLLKRELDDTKKEYITQTISGVYDKTNNVEYFNSDDVISDIYVYEGQDLVTDYTYNETDHTITFNITDNNEHTYLIIYKLAVESFQYYLEYPANPWFQIEVYGQGNDSKNGSGSVGIIFHKCQLATNYNVYSSNTTNQQTLSFNILHSPNDCLMLY